MVLALKLENRRFGRLLVIKRDGSIRSSAAWSCLCDCGKIARVISTSLVHGVIQSCGCYGIECRDGRNTRKHGKSKTKEYSVWKGIKKRCYSKLDRNYKNYGARGISVCDEWINSFDKFFSDMGKCPTSKHSIDRLDVNGNYEPSNCKWSTNKEQCQNKRTNLMITYLGQTKCLSKWCEELNLDQKIVRSRLKKYGMPPELAFTKKSKKVFL